MKIRLLITATSVVATISLLAGCSGEATNSQEVTKIFCQTSHSMTSHDISKLNEINVLTERSASTGKSSIFIPSLDDEMRIQVLVREPDGINASAKNQAVIAKNREGTFLSTSPQYKVDQNLIIVFQLPYHVLESVELTQAVKANNSQTGAVTFYPTKETNVGYEHPLNSLEEILDPGSKLPTEVSNYLLSNLSSGGIMIPDISKEFINFGKVKTVTDFCR